MLITPDKPTSYEQFALDTAIHTLREVIEVISITSGSSDEDIAKRNFNINRVYSALAQLQRIEL